MELRHLRAFSAAAEEKNLSKACGVVHVTQPALSRQIKLLEEELGVSLFVRTSTGVKLTDLGRVFLRSSKHILSITEAAMREVSDVGRTSLTRFNLGFDSGLRSVAVLQSLQEFGILYPLVELRIVEAQPHRLVQHLRDRICDAVLFASDHLDLSEDIEDVQLWEVPLRILLGSHHVHAGLPMIDLALMKNTPLIILDGKQEQSYKQAILYICKRSGFAPTVITETNSYLSMMGLIAAQRGYALFPEEGTSSINSEAIVSRRLKHTIPVMRVRAAWLRNTDSVLRTDYLNIIDRQQRAFSQCNV